MKVISRIEIPIFSPRTGADNLTLKTAQVFAVSRLIMDEVIMMA